MSNSVRRTSGAGIRRERSSSDLKKPNPAIRVASTSDKYPSTFSVVESASGRVHSNGSSHSRVVMPPKVFSTIAPDRRMYSPQEKGVSVRVSSRGRAKSISSEILPINSRECRSRTRNLRSKPSISCRINKRSRRHSSLPLLKSHIRFGLFLTESAILFVHPKAVVTALVAHSIADGPSNPDLGSFCRNSVFGHHPYRSGAVIYLIDPAPHVCSWD